MSQYRLKIDKPTKRGVDNLSGNIKHRIWRIIYNLLDDPYPPESEQMRDDLANARYIHVAEWRIVYEVHQEILIVEVVRVGRKSGPDKGPSFYDGLRPRN